MKIDILELPDFEGDDILGSAAKKYASKSIDGDKINCYILSGDRDLFQLVQIKYIPIIILIIIV